MLFCPGPLLRTVRNLPVLWFSLAVTTPALAQVSGSDLDAAIDQHQIPLRGHNIFWGIPNPVQGWLKELPDEELREVVKTRARDIGRRYRGRFAEYDLNNEMIHGNYYEQRLGKEITLQMAQRVRQEDPQAVLYLNDYDILTGNRLEDYLQHIRSLLDQGAPIGGLGVQGHLHGDTFDPNAEGRCEVRAFCGQHRVRVGDQERVVELSKARGRQVVSFK